MDRHLHGDLLALADGDEVDVLEVALDRVADDALRERELVAVLGLQGQQGVGVVLERQHQLVAREREVARDVAVAVEDRRHLVGPADAPRRALAELGAGLGGDADLGHSGTPRTVRVHATAGRWARVRSGGV